MRIITGFGVIYDMATLRPEPETDERTFLYNLGDNIIGYPDDYETLGEQLKSYVGDNSYKVRNQLSLSELAKSGITSAQDMVSGFKDSVSDRGIMGALFDIPVESVRPIVEGVSSLYNNEYSGPSRYDDMMVDAAKASGIGEIAKVSGYGLLAGGVPLALGRGIVGSIDDIGGPLLDRTLLDQNNSRAFAFASESELTPTAPPPTNAGQFESSNDHAVQAAIDDYNFGASSPEYIESTSGIRIVPRTDAAGNQEGVVSAGYVFPSETFGLNVPTTAGTYKLKDLVLSTKIKNRAVFEGVDVKFEPDDTGNAGGYSTGTRTIYVNSDMSPELQLETLKHESEHLFMDAARIPSSVLGGNEADLFSYKVKRLNDLEAELTGAKRRSEISEANYTRLNGVSPSGNELSDYRAIGAATFKDLSSERDALNSFTAKEMYYMNPGEFFARSSEGAVTGDFIPKRLSARDALNPFLNNVPLSSRLDEIIGGSIMPESRAVKLARMGENSPTAKRGLSVFNTTPTNLASDLYHDNYLARGATSGETRDFMMPVTAAQSVEMMRQLDRDGTIPFENGGRITGRLGSMGYMS